LNINFVTWYSFDLIAYVFFSFILYNYMFSKLTHSLFVFASLALLLQNRSSIGYESWSQVHAFHEDLYCVVYYFGGKHRSDSDTGKEIFFCWIAHGKWYM